MRLETLPDDYQLPEVGPHARVSRAGVPDPEGAAIMREANKKRAAAWRRVKKQMDERSVGATVATEQLVPPDVNPLPPLDEATEAALRDSIRRYGVLVPIVCDVEGNVIDGHHRLRILKELREAIDEDWVGHNPPLVAVVAPKGWQEEYPPSGRTSSKWHKEHPSIWHRLERSLGVDVYLTNNGNYLEVDPYEPDNIIRTLNLDRRQLTAKQREAVIVHLRENGHSVRAIARAVGISKSQAERDAARLSRAGQLTTPDKVTGEDGRKRPARKPTLHVVPDPEPDPIEDDDDVADGEIVEGDGNTCHYCDAPLKRPYQWACLECSDQRAWREMQNDVRRIMSKVDRWADVRPVAMSSSDHLRAKCVDSWRRLSQRAAAIADELES